MNMRQDKKLVKLIKWKKLLMVVIIVTLIWSICIGLSAIPTISLDYSEYEMQFEPQLSPSRSSHLGHLSNVASQEKSVNWNSVLRRPSRNLKNVEAQNKTWNPSEFSAQKPKPANTTSTNKKGQKRKKKSNNRSLPDYGSGYISNSESYTTTQPARSVLNRDSIEYDTSTDASSNFNASDDSADQSTVVQNNTTSSNISDDILSKSTSADLEQETTTSADVEQDTTTSTTVTTPATTTSPCRLEIPVIAIPKSRLKSDAFRVKWTPVSKLNATYIIYRKIESNSETIKNLTKDSFDDFATPCTNYTVCAKAFYPECGLSKENCSSFVTLPGKPPKVENLTAICERRTATIEWLISLDKCSDSENINVTVKKNGDVVNTNLADISNRSMDIPDLKPYSDYDFVVTVIGKNGDGEPAIKSCRTSAAEPTKINNPNRTEEFGFVNITWDAPSEQNGELEVYNVEFSGKRFNEMDNTCHLVNTNISCNSSTLHFEDLCGDSNYTLIIQAKNVGVAKLGKKTYFNFSMMAGPPPCQSSVNSKKNNMTVKSNPSNKKAEVEIEFDNFLCSNKNGSITHYDIILSGSQHANEQVNQNSTWFKSHEESTLKPYFTTPLNWNPFDSSNKVTYLVGNEADCDKKSAEERCNGPLRPGTNYSIKIRAYTTGGYSDTKVIYIITDHDDNDQVTIIIIIIALLIIIIAIAVVILKRKNILNLRYYQKFDCLTAEPEDSNRPIPIRATSKPILLSDFENNYKIMSADACLKFSMEFEELSYVSPKCPTSVAQREENRPKNRWVNILPFDHSRVKLLPIADDASTDYINATYIPGYKSQREYIASQGPLPNTKDDFWRMIWEQNSPMIVMVTQCVERGKSKCEEYWPTDRDVHYYGDLAVRLKSESILTDYNLRIFELQLGSRTMEVKQMHFTMWPDFGCPENTSLLINFIRSVQDHMPHETTGPMVVHCSAGVGRTGTFLAVDKLMQHIQEHDFVDIYGTVREMRHFRTNMVQTEDQYIYIHECIRDLLLESKNKNLSTSDSGEPEFETVSLLSHASTVTPTLRTVPSSSSSSTKSNNRLLEMDMTCMKSSNGTKRQSYRNTVM